MSINMNNYLNLYNHIINLINNDDYGALNSIDVNQVFLTSQFTQETVMLLISNLTSHVVNDESYKFEKYNDLFLVMVNIICKFNKDTNTVIPFDVTFLSKLSILNKGQVYLEKLKPYIVKQICNDVCKTIMTEVCRKGTLPTYFFWKRIKKNEVEHNIKTLLGESCINNDLRILKQILKDETINELNQIEINNLFMNIFDTRNTPKKQFKMLKLINEKIPLKPYFTYMLNNTELSFNKIKKLCQYYHTEDSIFTFDLLLSLLQVNVGMIFQEENDNIDISVFNEIESLLITPYENILFIIAKNMYYNNNNNNELNIIGTPLFLQVIKDNKTSIINFMVNHNILHQGFTNPIISSIITEYANNKYFNEFLINNSVFSYYKKIGFYTRFYSSKDKNMIHVNYLLHKLRCYAKRYKKNKITEIKFKTAPIINEIKNFIPNKFKTVLNKGSYTYQLSKQKFTTLPPRHIIPYEINYLNNCLIKEKSDGINVTKLPINIYPNEQKIIDTMVKAEYIEELDLYLVYDINIDNMTIIERQEYLRSIHPHTEYLKNLQVISNMEELKVCIQYERNNLKNFLENCNSEIKWYPKASFRINNFSQEFIKEINNFIEETDLSLNNYINIEGIIKNDGLIVSPLDCSREIKVKPKSLMTIDLLCKNNKWYDDNNNLYTNIIIKGTPKEGKIYRCYPIIENNIVNFVPKEIRYDKKRPNSSNICKTINAILSFNWLNNLEENSNYYQKSDIIYDNKVKKILEQNKTIFNNYIRSIKPLPNKYWLDLGCGKCKFYNTIKNYNPKRYVGIDYDIKSLIKAYKTYHTEDDFEIHNCDLNNEWTNYGLKLFEFDYNIKFDYIICNFSLMHFSSDKFWEQLNKISKPGTQFIFNVTKSNVNWEMNKSYLKSNNTQTEIFLEWIHKTPVKENILSSEYIINLTEKYKWKIIKTDKNTSNNLISCYDWYFLEK